MNRIHRLGGKVSSCVVVGKHCKLHGDLVRRISSKHVLYHEATAGMLVLPCIEAEDGVIFDDDAVASSDEAFDFSPGKGSRCGHARVTTVCGGG